MENKKTSLLYKMIKGLVRFFYPKMEAVGTEYLPEGPAILVGNHAKMNGPITAELYVPGYHYTWCIGEMMHLKDVPDYAYKDFWWDRKPKWIRWFYRLLSYIIAPFSVCVFNNANTIGVYHDTRLIGTFRETLEKLQEGARVVIFPEHDEDYNHILCGFQQNFTDVAKQYYARTKKPLPFVPMYIAPELKKLCFGKPIYYDPGIPIKQQRGMLCDYLMEEITRIAVELPEHTVVPYRNIPKKDYPKNHAARGDRSAPV